MPLPRGSARWHQACPPVDTTVSLGVFMRGFTRPWLARLSRLILAAAVLSAAVADAAEAPRITPEPGTVTYIDFWASWCAPCAESFPWLNQMQARYAAKGLRIVGVGLDTQDTKAERFLKEHPAQFKILRDVAGSLAEQYGVEGMPYAVLIDANGKVLHRHSGYHPAQADEYEHAIQAALAAATSGDH